MATEIIPIGDIQVATDVSMAQQIETDGSLTQGAVDGRAEVASAAYLSGAPAVTAAAAAAAAAAVGSLDLLQRSDPVVPKFVPGMSGVLLPVYDSADNLAHSTVADDLGPLPFWKDYLVRYFQTRSAIITPSMLTSAVTDNIGGGYVATVTGTTPNRVLSTDSSKGTHAVIANTGDPSNPDVTADGWVLFDTTTGRKARKADGTGDIVPAVTAMDSVSTWGDSGTAVYPLIGVDEAETYTARLAVLLGLGTTPSVSYYNGGRGGQEVEEIGMRQGGVTYLTGSSLTIPASGSVNVPISPAPQINSSLDFTVGVTLAGVAGTFARAAGSSTYVFTRTTSGSTVAVPAGTQVISVPGPARRSSLQVFAGLMNDVIYITGQTGSQIAQRGITVMKKMAAYHGAYSKRFLVIGTWTQATWGNSTSQWATVKEYHDGLAAEFGDRFVPFRDMVIANATTIAATNGITLDSADTAALAANTFPPSFMADSVHYKDFIHTEIANYLYARCVQKGWV